MRYGLVGTGHWAEHVHAAALSAHVDAQFIGLWGRNVDAAHALAAQHKVRTFATPEALYRDVDAVAFAVPPDVQAALAPEAARHGCHLLLEKPIALDSAAADVLATTVRSTGVQSVLFVTPRFDDHVSSWLTTLSARGGWQSGHVTYHGSLLGPDNPFASSRWRRAKGPLWDLGPHALSLLLPVLGQPAAVAGASANAGTTRVVLRHAAERWSTMSLSLATLPGATRFVTTFTGSAGRESMTTDAAPIPAMLRALQALDEAVATGNAPECDVMFGRSIVHVIECASRRLRRRLQRPEPGPPVAP